jgi:hypothetical protein
MQIEKPLEEHFSLHSTVSFLDSFNISKTEDADEMHAHINPKEKHIKKTSTFVLKLDL